MRLCFTLVFITVINNASFEEETSTMFIMDRIEVLKEQIKVDNRLRRGPLKPLKTTLLNEDADYVELQTPFTPIMNVHNGGRFKLRPLKTTKQPNIKHIIRMKPPGATPASASNVISLQPVLSRLLEPERSIAESKMVRSQKETEERIKLSETEPRQEAETPFYRRIGDKTFLQTPLQWAHCQDTITQFLTGVKTDTSSSKSLGPKNHHVIRLLQLLSLNTTTYTAEEVYAVLYQINDIKIRLFQWNKEALALLFRVLTQDKSEEEVRHTFKTVRYGIKGIIDKLHLNYSNTTNLLRMTKIFRPPCMKLPQQGSTRRSKVVKYTKSIEPTKKCVKKKMKPFECEDD